MAIGSEIQIIARHESVRLACHQYIVDCMARYYGVESGDVGAATRDAVLRYARVAGDASAIVSEVLTALGADELHQRVANLERQNTDLQEANNRLLERARGAELALSRASIPLTFDALRRANIERFEERFQPLSETSPSDWGVIFAGEAGAVCTAINKFRQDAGYVRDVAVSLVGTVLYADLLAARLGIDLAQAMVRGFNAVSQSLGADQFLAEIMPVPAPEAGAP